MAGMLADLRLIEHGVENVPPRRLAAAGPILCARTPQLALFLCDGHVTLAIAIVGQAMRFGKYQNGNDGGRVAFITGSGQEKIFVGEIPCSVCGNSLLRELSESYSIDIAWSGNFF